MKIQDFLDKNEEQILKFYNKPTLLQCLERAVYSEYERRRFYNIFGEYPVEIYNYLFFNKKV
jgi:hypothetical protein